jgi:hypothetical protein
METRLPAVDSECLESVSGGAGRDWLGAISSRSMYNAQPQRPIEAGKPPLEPESTNPTASLLGNLSGTGGGIPAPG